MKHTPSEEEKNLILDAVFAPLDGKPPVAGSVNCSAACLDCQKPYDDFKLDTLFSREDWLKIHPKEHGLLCANCIVKRASLLPRIVAVRARLQFADEFDEPNPRPTIENDLWEINDLAQRIIQSRQNVGTAMQNQAQRVTRIVKRLNVKQPLNDGIEACGVETPPRNEK